MLRECMLGCMLGYMLIHAVLCQEIDNNTKQPPRPSRDYPLHAVLDSNDQYHLYWSFDNEYVTFEVHVRTSGWVGLGFTHNGRMTGADIVVAWIKDGRTYFKDSYAEYDGPPMTDKQQDYSLIMAHEKDGFTIVQFRRKINTCDDQDLSLEGTIRVIYAWNDADPMGDELTYQNKHAFNGAMELVLLSKPNPPFNPDNYTADYILHDKVVIPTKMTYYHCRYVTFPATNVKRHVIRFAAIVEPGNEKYVHHLVVYSCNTPKVSQGNGFDCDEAKGMMGDGCNTTMYAWAIGQGDFVLPEEAGFPWGGDGKDLSVKLEIHYNNPDLHTGVQDSSGVVIHHTDKLRQEDAATLVVGQVLNAPKIGGVNIPPGMVDFHMNSYCDTGSCTDPSRDLIPRDGVKVFAAFLHTHTAATGMWTRHIRDGVELPDLGYDPNYDFDYQALRQFNGERHILPRDQIITTCVYNTAGKQNVTIGGEGTDEEMCVNFLYYYPKMDIGGCHSHVQHSAKWFPLVERRAREGYFGANYTMPGAVKPEEAIFFTPFLNYDEETRELVKQMEEEGGYIGVCSLVDNQTFSDTGRRVKFAMEPMFPVIRESLVDKQCPGGDYPEEPTSSAVAVTSSILALLVTAMVASILA